MRRMGRRVFITIGIMVLFGVPFFAYAGFGVSPPTIIEHNLVPGSTITRTINLVQGDPQVPVGIQITVESAEAKEWFSFHPGSTFTIPAGIQQFPLDVTVTVPKDAALNEYRAFIRINTAPDTAENSGEVSISVGGRVDVELTVGDNVIKQFGIRAVDILSIGEGDDLAATIRVENSGNVPAGPTAATFELFDKFGSTRLAFSSAPEHLFYPIEPFTEELLVVTFPLELTIAQGEYWGNVRIFDEGGDVVRELRDIFEVKPPGDGDEQPRSSRGAVRGASAFIGRIMDSSPILLGALGAFGVFVLITIIRKIFRRRRL